MGLGFRVYSRNREYTGTYYRHCTRICFHILEYTRIYYCDFLGPHYKRDHQFDQPPTEVCKGESEVHMSYSLNSSKGNIGREVL